MRNTLTITVIALSALFMSNCHTYAWQSVGEQILGTWTLQPVEPTYIEQWTFANGQLMIDVNGSTLMFDDNGTTVDHMTYRVDNLITNHYVIIETLPTVGNQWPYLHNDIVRWLVITSGDNELYLESITSTGLKGGYQFHFYKV